MNHFEWKDYTKEDTALVASWLNADAVRMTGMDEGFDAFHQYWKNESSPERGEYFSTKLVSENGHLFAARTVRRWRALPWVRSVKRSACRS